MSNSRTRNGRAAEFRVFGEMLAAGLDCYLTIVDDQAIDAIIRVPTGEGDVSRYYDVQIKSSQTWAGLRGNVAALAGRPNAILVLFNASTGESLWLDANAIRTLFPAKGGTWGDIFLNSATVESLKGTHRLEHLKEQLGL